MKFFKNNFKLIIGFTIVVILTSSITVYAYNYLASDVKYTSDKSVEDALNELYSRTNSYITMDSAYLQSGTIVGNASIINTNTINSSYGLSITGNSNTNDIVNNRWEKEIDFTNISRIVFYAKKGQNHGSIRIYIDNYGIMISNWNDFSESWRGYFVDVSQYTGIHTLKIGGGWGDESGNSGSNTQYCDIRLYK